LVRVTGTCIGEVRLRIGTDSRGISNVIIVMLSLMLVAIVVGNVFLWQFQMNQADLERMQEKVEILDVTSNTTGEVTIKLKNEGSLTVHIVSLWVNNATLHKRYDVDLFINPGETLPYTRTDIALPEGDYIIKVVTERGNIAVYSKE
jgi:hypothetical protein